MGEEKKIFVIILSLLFKYIHYKYTYYTNKKTVLYFSGAVFSSKIAKKIKKLHEQINKTLYTPFTLPSYRAPDEVIRAVTGVARLHCLYLAGVSVVRCQIVIALVVSYSLC